jgi:Fe-S-cluster-containing dehydrogenase component
MSEKEKTRAILVKSDRCQGCLTCQLRCSLRACGQFNPSRARIRITRIEGEYKYRHIFTDKCDGCKGDYLCVRWCPYGTLKLGRRQ